MRIGYARVSTDQQETHLQIDALKKANCEVILEEKASGGSLSRPILLEMIKKLKSGDVVVIYKIDRMARSLKDLLKIQEQFTEIGVKIESVTDPIEMISAMGRFQFQIMGAYAELERAVIRERTIAGLAAAAARGRYGGRPSPIKKDEEEIVQLWLTGAFSKSNLAQKYNTSVSSIKRLLKRKGTEQSRPKQALLNF